MADNQVSFTISADTKPASKAILDLKKELKNVGTIKSVDKNVVAQQKDLKKVLEGINAAYEQQKSAYNQYELNAKKIEKQTAALAEEESFTQQLTEQYAKLAIEKEKGTITPEGVNTMSRLEVTIPHRLEQEEKMRASIAKLTEKNAQLDEYSAQMLQHILGPEKEIVRDEQTALGYKIQQRQIAQDTATAEEEFERSTNKANDALNEQANNAKKTADAIERTKNKQNTAQETPIDNATDIEKEKEAYQELRATIVTLKADVMQVNDAMATDTASNNILELIRRYRTLTDAKKQMETIGMHTKDLDGTYATTIRLLAQLNTQINAYKKNLEKTDKSVNKSAKSLKLFAINAKTIKSAFNSLHKTQDKVKSSFNSMAKSMRSNFKHLITSMTKYVLGFRSLFFLVRRLRKYIGEGIENMAKFNDGNNYVNEGITNLLSSLLFLKNAWATAFSPIIQFVQGWLDVLIDKLAEVGNAIARFIARILGTGQAFQAVKVRAADYASGLDGVGDSAGGAADKTKKLTDRLAAFDDLDVLGVDKDPENSGSGGGGSGLDAYTPDPNEMFKIIDIEDSGLMEKLKKSWETADFTWFGELIKNKIIDALPTGDDWDSIQARAGQFAQSLGSFIDGLFGDPELFKKAGETVGEGINTISLAISRLLDEIEDTPFGANFAEGLNTFLSVTDWELAGDNINRVVTGIAGNVTEFLRTLDTDKLISAVEDFMKGLDIKEMAMSILELTVEATKVIVKVVGTLVWDGLITPAGIGFGDALWNWVSEGQGGIVKTADGAEIPFKVNLNFGLNAEDTPILSLLTKLLTGVGPIEAMIKVGFELGGATNLVDGETMQSLLDGSYDWNNFFSFWLSGDATDNTNSTMTRFSDDLNNLALASKDTYDKVWLDAEGIKGAFRDMRDELPSIWDTIVTDATTNWNTFRDNVTGAVDTAWTNIKTTVDTWKTNLSQTWFDIRTTAVSNFWTMKSKIVEAFEALRDGAKNIINNGILPVVEDMINFLIDGLNSFIDRLNSIPDVTFRSPFTGEDITLGVDLSRIGYVSIPRLAQGAVIPPNREFMAVLGDQSHGTNIEAPLDTIKQAVAEVMGNSGNAEVIQLLQQLITVVENKKLAIGDKEIAKANQRYVNQQKMIRGTTY